jgi:lipopolysaccharide/colanic/teichoic acid biosynthesis glycosyltransferase
MLKILIDLIGAFLGLVLTFPLLIVAMILIIIFDRQNPIFIQGRLGKSKLIFQIIKLRTMKNNQVTTLGNFLRKTGIDEIPQLLNILFLQMSFVGPRPLTQADIERLGWNDSYHQTRWNGRPGITGLAQLSPICHKKMSWFLDKKYIHCQNILLDLKIVFSSIAVLFVGKKKAVQWMHSNRSHAGTR